MSSAFGYEALLKAGDSIEVLDEVLLHKIHQALCDEDLKALISQHSYVQDFFPLLSEYLRDDETISYLFLRFLSLLGMVRSNAQILTFGAVGGLSSAFLSLMGMNSFAMIKNPSQAQKTRKILDKFHFQSAMVRVSDDTRGWSDYAPYDVYIIWDILKPGELEQRNSQNHLRKDGFVLYAQYVNEKRGMHVSASQWKGGEWNHYQFEIINIPSV